MSSSRTGATGPAEPAADRAEPPAGGSRPGRRPADRIAAVALVVAPLVWLAAVIVRFVSRRVVGFTAAQDAAFAANTFAAPQQLATYARNPVLTTAGYVLFALAALLLLPAFFGLARVVAARAPWFATVGGLLVAFSLMSRLYFSGVDFTAFSLVDRLGVDRATTFVMHEYVHVTYGLWYVPVTASAGALLGSVLLALAAYRSRVLGLARAALFAYFWGWTFLGVLKDSNEGTIAGGLALVLVMLPLGIAALRGRTPATAPSLSRWPWLRPW